MPDFKQWKNNFKNRINNPESQRRMVLCVVCVALLLDNMLYMVIVPIIPGYLEAMSAISHKQFIWTNGTYSQEVSANSPIINASTGPYQIKWKVHHSDAKIGTLFAFKAIIQLLFNPVSGTVIDRMGYDVPMMFGLCVIFVSTSLFAFGHSYGVMFIARGLQGMGSAFADTAGLAMIADRFTEEAERTKALGIALAFISFGSLVAPPFGGILYEYCGKELPFITLAFVALLDGFLLMAIMQPVRIERTVMKAEGNLPRGTPIHRLLMDPFIAICAGALAFANISLAFLEPTISNWMSDTMQATETQEGLVWLPAFLPHLAGVITTVKLAQKYPKYQWLMAAIGLAIEGISCFFIPFCRHFVALMVPIGVLCYGIALVDTAILPTMAFLVDSRHVSVYGSVYAIADISYNLAYALGPIIAGGLVQTINFLGLNIFITLSTLTYVPVLYLLRNCYSDEAILQASRELRRKSTISLGPGAGAAGKAYRDSISMTDTQKDTMNYPGYEQSQPFEQTRLTANQFGTNQTKSVPNDLPMTQQDGYGYG
ncbi:unnamed protein product [Echinostoma caproni]|uniref:MFS domain-containing protein n=1 Tax=Echinostoma caproni TaxID=27848 RepID=A0A183A9G3_9TREM|nr:unnamed protein product [Echinostoma caproni]